MRDFTALYADAEAPRDGLFVRTIQAQTFDAAYGVAASLVDGEEFLEAYDGRLSLEESIRLFTDANY